MTTDSINHSARYRIEREIASGGMATVFLAEDTVLGRRVALKRLHPHLLDKPEAMRRFETEAHAIASLSHENIIKLYDYSKAEASSDGFLAMEFVDGKTLECILLEAGGGLPNLVALEIFLGVFSGLVAAHKQGIYHRDIKPSNILVDFSGCVRITDFGIAYLVQEDGITATGSFVGSTHYISPEQVRGDPVTDRADIFSAGAMLYECLTGVRPFAGSNPHATIKAIVERNPTHSAVLNGKILPGLADLVELLLAKDPTRRPSAQACMETIENICRQGKFTIGKNRVARFLKGYAEYRAGEQEELGRHFRELARLEYGTGRSASCLKSLALAEQFGGLQAEDRKLRSRITRKNTWTWCVAVALLLSFFLLSNPLGKFWKENFEKNESRTAPLVLASLPSLAVSVLEKDLAPDQPMPDPIVALSPTTVKTNPSSDEAKHNAKTKSLAVVNTSHALVSPIPQSKPDFGYVQVKTNPPYVKILIDAIQRGETPLTSPIALAPGIHELFLLREGCRDSSREIRISAGDTLDLKIMLERTGP